MKKLWNRMLSLVLVLVLVLGMLPNVAAQEEVPTTRTVYLDVTEEKWGKAYVYFWSDEYAYLTTWPGEVMTLVKEGVYSYQVPAEAELVIFNNGNAQTRDLTLPTDGKDLYDLSSDTWTVYGEAQVTANGVTTVYATVREAVDAAALAEDSTVTLLSDISATEPVRVYSGRFTIDLNGKTWTESNTVLDLCGGDVRIIDSSTQGTGSLVSEAYAAIDLSSDAKLEVAGGTVQTLNGDYAIDTTTNGWTSNAVLTLSGGKLVSSNYAAINVDCKAVIIKGGQIESAGDDHNYQSGLLDFSQHPDPSGIAAFLWLAKIRTPKGVNIKLPAGYGLYEQSSNTLSALEDGYTYEVVKLAEGTQLPCTCEIKCNQETVDGSCPGCRADLTGCTGVAASPVSYRTLFFRNNEGWPEVYAYHLGSQHITAWPGVAMTEVEEGIWMGQVPADAVQVVFKNYGGQYDAVTIPTDEKNYYNAGTWTTYEFSGEAMVRANGTLTAYDTVQAAMDAAAQAESAHVTLYKDVENCTGITLFGGDVTLDMNGHSIKGSVTDNGILQLFGAKLTFTGEGTIENTGSGGFGISAKYNDTTHYYSDLTLLNGKILGRLSGIDTYKAHLTMEGGTVEGELYGIRAGFAGAINLYGGTVRGDTGVVAANGGQLFLGGPGMAEPVIEATSCGIKAYRDVIAACGTIQCPGGIGIYMGPYNPGYGEVGSVLTLNGTPTIDAQTDIYLLLTQNPSNMLVNVELSDGAYSVGAHKDKYLSNVIAAPGAGITLKRTWFTSANEGEYVQYTGTNGKLSLLECLHGETVCSSNQDNATHDVYCMICNNSVQENAPCTAENYYPNGNGTHYFTCTGCGEMITQACRYTNGVCLCGGTCTHRFTEGKCTVCGINQLRTVTVLGDPFADAWEDAPKNAWESGDQVRITFESASQGLQRAKATYDGSQWTLDGAFLYADGETPTVTAVYAPDQLGTDEYLPAEAELESGALQISFENTVRTYSRLRLVGELGGTVYYVSITNFIPAGGSFTDHMTYELSTDMESGDLYLYGTFTQGATVTVMAPFGEKPAAEYTFEAPSEAGKSYTVCILHTADPVIDQTCMGYRCKLCGQWFGQIGENMHEEVFVLSADGATCTAVCQYCDATLEEVTIVAPACKTYGDGGSCSVTGLVNGVSIGGDVGASYYRWETDRWVKLDGACAQPGTYRAEVLLFPGNEYTTEDDVVIWVEYTIAPGPFPAGTVAVVGDHAYTTVQAAVDNAGDGYVKLLADSQEAVVAQGDLYLDLNGYDLASLTVTGTLYGMDGTTDDYDCTGGYGTIEAFAGTYAPHHRTAITGSAKRYVGIMEENVLSFHRIYVGVTHMSLEAQSVSFGYKAQFHGDAMIAKYLTAYGFHVWVDESNKLTLTGGAQDFVSGDIKTLRVQNVLTPENGDDANASALLTTVYADATVTLEVNGQTVTINSQPVSGTMKQLLEKVNADPGPFTEAQLTALKTILTTYAKAVEAAGCKVDNLT